jgi:hypothetical protein
MSGRVRGRCCHCDAIHRENRARLLLLSPGAAGSAKDDGDAPRRNAGIAQRFHDAKRRRNVIQRKARRQENDVRRNCEFEAELIVLAAGVNDDVVVVEFHALKLLLLGKRGDLNHRFGRSRLTLSLPAHAGPLLDVEIRKQHFAVQIRKRDRG